jgi:dihydroorotate dehydrogenase (NAD+) catalytic subunit
MMKPDLKITVSGVTWKNPVTTGSGTFALKHSRDFYDVTRLGAVTTKGVSKMPWSGNPMPRVAETYGGMLNSIGLENNGVKELVEGELKELKEMGMPVVVNVAGKTMEEYQEVVRYLEQTDVDMLEINLSCPNLKEGGMSFGVSPKETYRIITALRKLTQKPLYTKLSPNVTDIVEIAEKSQEAGADGLTLINTLMGMRIDVNTGRPVLARGVGGLSGPCIKPVAIRMVYQVAKRVQIPIIGGGGITSGEDAVEFLMAGASGVFVGTAALVDPSAPVRIIQELEDFMSAKGYGSVEELREAGKKGW